MSLAPGKSDLKKHLSRHIHLEKELQPLSRSGLPEVVGSSKVQVDSKGQVNAGVARLRIIKPLA